MKRRLFLQGMSLTPILVSAATTVSAADGATKSVEALQKDWKSYLAQGAKVASPAPPLKHSEQEWRKILTPAQYDVLREEGTERPGSSPLNAEKRAGVFTCAGCTLPLFTSAMKFESGTGWPSFFTTIPGALATKTDFKLVLPRTEYHCVRCGGHHGHLFDDGPAPTGQRYCNNGIALQFIPRSA